MILYNTNKGARISLLIGAPLGIGILFLSFLALMDMGLDENAIFLAIPLFLCSQVLLISFLVILWRAGRNANASLLKGEQRLWVVFKYATTVSLVMGGIFSGVFIVSWSFMTFLFIVGGVLMFAKLFFFILAIFGGIFIISFLIGLLVCYAIQWQINKDSTSY